MNGIWVRGQLKNRLVLCSAFSATMAGMVLGFQGPDDEEGVPLGTYENEARAIEVLNILQNNCKREYTTVNLPEQ